MIQEATGLSIILGPGGGTEMHACRVSVNANKLTIENKRIGLASPEQLPAGSVVALNLSGKGVLQKQIEKTDEITQHNFGSILPNAQIDDFYVQHFISGESSFVSVIRKSEADRWIGQLRTQGLVPVMLSLGPFPVVQVLPQLNIYDQDIIFNGYAIQRNEQGEWLSFRYDASASSPFPLKVDSESLDEKLLIPYAAAFQVVLEGKLEPVKADVPSVDSAFINLTADKKLKARGALILGILFVLLLVNFMVFSWLNRDNARLTEQVSRSAQSTEDIRHTDEQVRQKESLLNLLGWEGTVNKSVLLDQVAAILPPEVSWTEAAVDPIDIAAGRAQKTIAFFNRRIRITGSSEKIIPVNEWIARVKTKPWVKSIRLDSYTFNNELNTGQFTVVIDY